MDAVKQALDELGFYEMYHNWFRPRDPHHHVEVYIGYITSNVVLITIGDDDNTGFTPHEILCGNGHFPQCASIEDFMYVMNRKSGSDTVTYTVGGIMNFTFRLTGFTSDHRTAEDPVCHIQTVGTTLPFDMDVYTDEHGTATIRCETYEEECITWARENYNNLVRQMRHIVPRMQNLQLPSP